MRKLKSKDIPEIIKGIIREYIIPPWLGSIIAFFTIWYKTFKKLYKALRKLIGS